MDTFMNVKKIFIFSGLVYSNIFGTDFLNFFGNFAKDNELVKEGLAIGFEAVVGKEEYYGNNDIGKLKIIKEKLEPILLALKANCGILVKIFNECNFNELKNCKPDEIKSYILSKILFCGDTGPDITPIKKDKEKVVIMFHGMSDNANSFQNNNFFNKKNGFDIYAIEYNNCDDLNEIDEYIEKQVESYYEALQQYDKIFIYGFSMGCFIANKFRGALIKKINDNNKRIYFIFDKGFYDITKTKHYHEVFKFLKKFNYILRLDFVDDTSSDNAIVELTSNFNILKNAGGNNIKYFIETTNVNHNAASDVLLKNIYNQINKDENKNNNCIYFIDGGNNDNMVGSSPLMLYNALTNSRKKQGGENGKEGFPDCCACCNVPS